MSRTNRLFELIELLRQHRRPVTAAALAQELSVSMRTVYRDVQTLIGLGAPIDGEAGLGYVLRPGFFVPPLMFDQDELDALVLGARWVRRQGDPVLARAAANALAKIAAASPKDLRDHMAETGLWAASRPDESQSASSLHTVRHAIRRGEKLRITYRDQSAAETQRVIWPIGLAFFERARVVAAWCELRGAFRHFRADRIRSITPLGEHYPTRRAALVRAWQAEIGLPELDS
ncbi:helix-turn-helix transcriptional regulator [Microvirga makkahensis]|uniref:HTH domain-containing protein n=1 Tax=Microvirga makkahensis TaxID=1128670 RepID=A0A7X3MUT2_9HYPH|nr:YafY family protein [Microvirga makkahensis]MXQ13597.1 HTH domain-containing protein [Microvirga makkahensis]